MQTLCDLRDSVNKASPEDGAPSGASVNIDLFGTAQTIINLALMHVRSASDAAATATLATHAGVSSSHAPDKQNISQRGHSGPIGDCDENMVEEVTNSRVVAFGFDRKDAVGSHSLEKSPLSLLLTNTKNSSTFPSRSLLEKNASKISLVSREQTHNVDLVPCNKNSEDEQPFLGTDADGFLIPYLPNTLFEPILTRSRARQNQNCLHLNKILKSAANPEQQIKFTSSTMSVKNVFVLKVKCVSKADLATTITVGNLDAANPDNRSIGKIFKATKKEDFNSSCFEAPPSVENLLQNKVSNSYVGALTTYTTISCEEKISHVSKDLCSSYSSKMAESVNSCPNLNVVNSSLEMDAFVVKHCLPKELSIAPERNELSAATRTSLSPKCTLVSIFIFYTLSPMLHFFVSG